MNQEKGEGETFQFPSFDEKESDHISKSNTVSINIEEEDKFEIPNQKPPKNPPNFSFTEFPPIEGANSPIDSFQFSFDDFQPDEQNDQAAFTFDINEKSSSKNEEEQLYQKFVTLISNPCFEYKGKPLKELFKQEDEAESIEAAYQLLIQAYQ